MVIHNVKRADSGAIPTKKPKAGRNPTSGKFDAGDPHTDPELMDQLVRMVRAVRDLEPFLSASVLMFTQLGDKTSASLAALVGGYLSTLKDEALRDLAAEPESLKDAKKRRLDAKRLGNIPLQEQQRIQQRAADWLIETEVTPRQLASAHPEVLRSIMAVAAHLAVCLPPGGDASALPSGAVVSQLGQDGVS
jgi:hypothetical protein